jgi:Zn-dependent protease
LNCEFCGKEESLPFVCNYCGKIYCIDHRLPEVHKCSGDTSKSPVITSSSIWESNYPTSSKVGLFSRIEVRDIILAWLALSVAFLIARGRVAFGAGLLANLSISFIAVGSGFVLHELMHKFTAQRYGYWAEFRMWPFGVIFALLTSIAGVIFAAPGATYIKGFDVSNKENGVISLAGPITNVVVGLSFLPLLLVRNIILQEIASVGLTINLFLAVFNMLPVLPLDGAKVFAWNKIIWSIFFVPLVIAMGFLFLGQI